MGWRFRRSVKILPGIRLNFGKRGVSTSIGARGAHITVGHGTVRETVGLPGTGISYTHVEGTHQEARSEAQPAEVAEPLPKGRTWRGWFWVVLLVAIVGALAYGTAKSAEAASAGQNTYFIEPAPPDPKGTEQQPFVVGKTMSERTVDRADQAEHSTNERRSTIATIIMSIFTILVLGKPISV